MFISAAAILDSSLNKNIKGIIYVFGALLTMLLGNLLSSSFPNRVPGIFKGTTNRDPQNFCMIRHVIFSILPPQDGEHYIVVQHLMHYFLLIHLYI